MNSSQEKFAPLGEVVATVFDEAECCSTHPAEVLRLASFAVMHLWLRGSKSLAARPLPEVARQVLR